MALAIAVWGLGGFEHQCNARRLLHRADHEHMQMSCTTEAAHGSRPDPSVGGSGGSGASFSVTLL